MNTRKQREVLQYMFLVYSFTLSTLFVGCHGRKTITQEHEFEKWSTIRIGLSISDVVNRLGSPDSTVSDGDEKMLSYQTKVKNNKLAVSNLRVDAFMVIITNGVVKSTHIGYRR